MMNDDMELVRAYAIHQSEQAFETLVSRYVNLVYSTAVRQVRDAHLAEEITQAVFIILARKAASLGPGTILPSWLHRTTGFAAGDVLKIQRRRAQREQEAHMQSLSNESENEAWLQIAPLLDAAIAGLNEKDRHAIVLRFFQDKSLNEIGAALGSSEEAAKKRVNRALEKLQRFFLKRDVRSTTAILAGMISANSIQAAPATLAKTAAAAALTKGAMASTLIKTALKIMAWSKAKIGIVAGIGVLLAVGTSTLAVREIAAHKALDPRTLNESFWRLDFKTLNTAPQVVALRPSRGRQSGNISTETRMVALHVPLGALLYYAYAPNNIYYQFHHEYRAELAPGVDDGEFDLLLTLANHPQEALRAEIKKQLGLVAQFEPREADVLVLTCSNPATPILAPSHGDGWVRFSRGRFTFNNEPIFALTDFLESHFGELVVDQTGLTQHYTGTLNWNPGPDKAADRKAILQALSTQLGLELVSSRETVEMLVVEKAQ